MSWGETAKSALDHAVKAIQAIAEVKAVVQQIQVAAQNHEQRTNTRVNDLEGRIRELERELAKCVGLVGGGYSEALKVVLANNQPRVAMQERTRTEQG